MIFSEEEKEILRAFRNTIEHKTIVKLLKVIQIETEQRVLGMDLKTCSFADLALEKSKIDGIKDSINLFNRKIDDLSAIKVDNNNKSAGSVKYRRKNGK